MTRTTDTRSTTEKLSALLPRQAEAGRRKTIRQQIIDQFPSEEELELKRKQKQGDPTHVNPEELNMETDSTMRKLIKTILNAAAGKPLKTSITDIKEKQKQREQSVMFMLLDRMQNGPPEQKTEATPK